MAENPYEPPKEVNEPRRHQAVRLPWFLREVLRHLVWQIPLGILAALMFWLLVWLFGPIRY
jgi:hypothetical protein